MTIEQLCELPIKNLAADNAVLFLWVTSPLLEECFEVIEAWGFEYKASFIWDKVKHNYGHYNSVRHELLLLCTRGSCLPDNSELFDSVQSIERSDRHSEKPEEFRKIIDNLYHDGNRIELFARVKVEGWEAWGNEPSIIGS
jgi:N6-adenosine-specific RNA methylase IME4